MLKALLVLFIGRQTLETLDYVCKLFGLRESVGGYCSKNTYHMQFPQSLILSLEFTKCMTALELFH